MGRFLCQASRFFSEFLVLYKFPSLENIWKESVPSSKGMVCVCVCVLYYSPFLSFCFVDDARWPTSLLFKSVTLLWQRMHVFDDQVDFNFSLLDWKSVFFFKCSHILFPLQMMVTKCNFLVETSLLWFVFLF